MPRVPSPSQIFGTIRTEDNTLAQGYNLKLYLRSGSKESLLAEGTSDTKGQYRLSYHLPKIAKGRAISVFARVYSPSGQLAGEFFASENPAAKQKLDIQLVESQDVQLPARPTAPEIQAVFSNFSGKTVTVEGTISNYNGTPAAGVPVKVFEVSFGKKAEQERASGVSSQTGAYVLTFQTPNQAGSTAVQVKVFNPDGTVLETSPVRYHLLGNLRLDLRLPDLEPERTFTQWKSRFQIESPTWLDLNIVGLNELAARSGEPPQRVRRIAMAERVSSQQSIASELLYALFDKGLPEDLDRLVTLPTETLKEALKAAMAEGIIATAKWDAEIKRLKELDLKQPEKLVSPENYYKTPDKVKASEQPTVEKALNRYFREQVLEAIRGISSDFYELAETAVYELDYKSRLDQSFPEALRKTLELAADEDQDLLKEAIGFLKNRPQDNRKVRDVLQMDLSVQQHPALYEPLQRGVVFALADLAGIADKSIPTRLLERQIMADDWNEAALEPMVKQGVLTNVQSKQLSRVSLLARLTGQNLTLIRQLMTPANADLGSVARLNAAEWEQRLIKDQLPLPAGETTRTYAEKLNNRAGLLFPTAMLLDRFKRSLNPTGGQNMRDWLNTFETNNPNFDLLRAKLSPKNGVGLTWTGIPADNRPQVQNQLAAMQRVLVLSAHPEQASVLLEKGFNSAQKIARLPKSGFIKESGLSAEVASIVHERARANVSRAIQYLGTAQDAMAGGFKQIPLNNLPTDNLVSELKQIEGFEDLLGGGGLCSCSNCRSMLSPAAYLVDMMRFVEKRITEPALPEKPQPDVVLPNIRLRDRRPDLWSLQLTCETDKEVTQVSLFNEVLSAWLQSRGQDSVFEQITRPEATGGFAFPLHLPQAELRLYLSHFGVALHELYRDMQGDTDDAWRERLHLSKELFSVITTADTAGILARFGVSAIQDLDVPAFLQVSGLSRTELSDLLAISDLSDVSTEIIEIGTGPDKIYKEIFKGPTNTHLDYMHRFIRLWKQTGWTIKQVDVVLGALRTAGALNSSAINSNAVLALARACELAKRLSLSPEELATLLSSWETNKAHLAYILQWTAAQLEHALSLLAPLPASVPEQLALVLDFAEWLKGLPFGPAEMRFVKEGMPAETYTYRIANPTTTTLTESLAALFNFPQERFKELEETWISESFDNANIQSFAKAAERLLWAFNRFGWTPSVVDWVLQNPSRIGLADAKAKQWDLAWWQSLSAFHRLLPAGEEASEAFLKMLENPVNWTSIAALWKEEAVQVQSVANALNIADGTPLNLLDIQKGLACCKRLGLDGAQVKQLTDDSSFQSIENARNLVIGAFAAKYPAQSEQEKQVRPYKNQSEALKRDALLAWLLSRPEYGFKDTNDLYAYFLLDPEMDGCAQTSKIQAAHSTVQLYIHRVLMNLEQGGNGFSVLDNIPVDTLDELKQEWDWRKNYRVWEANRKVFLYPESYLEPDLRDNKTSIFRELEEELLQQELSKETAEAAFRNYFAKFDELAQLYIAGSFYHAETNTYYFFGRTRTTPYQYYFRKWENQQVWTAWEKMELPIDAGEISGIVLGGKLWVFWINIEEAFFLYLNYSVQSETGRWTTPQRKKLNGDPIYGLSSDSNQVIPSISKADNEAIYLTFYNSIGSQYSLANHLVWKIQWRNNEIQQIGYSSNQNYFLTSNGQIFIPQNTRFLKVRDNVNVLSILNQESSLTQASIDSGKFSFPNEELIGTHNGIVTTDVVCNRPNDSILKVDTKQYLAQHLSPLRPTESATESGTRVVYRNVSIQTLRSSYHKLIRLTPFLERGLSNLLQSTSINGFLSAQTQEIKEVDFPLAIQRGWLINTPLSVNHLDFTGPYGDYYRELFFHVPFLIAQQFNANQQFKEAKWWYERIFDPTATGKADDRDRPWQYLEFRDLDIQKMENILADEAALERYRRDPFNPHAIARLRITAYQKVIVMKYIDNLLDWGDDLFNRYGRENLNEAAMLYMLASDILGPRPAVFGECKVADDDQLTYENLPQKEKLLSDFLINLENRSIENALENLEGEPVVISNTTNDPAAALGDALAFCIPQNEKLQNYWDRVSDRMYKIRHCLDINGQRRMLPLYQPPIDPMLLVRAKAMGLSLDQVRDMIDDKVPHYRFAFLIERARQYAQTVQSFGSALLSALNSKDAEELMLLRSVQEREILRMGREVRKRNLEEAKTQMKSTIESKTNVEKRKSYYNALIETGLLDEEKWAAINKDIASAFYLISAGFYSAKAIKDMVPIPNIKAFLESIAENSDKFGKNFSIISEALESRGIKKRRKQDWQFQRDTAAQELKQIAQQLLAAEIRVSIAEKDLEIHERNIEHARELDDFYRDKFTSRGLFEYMSRTLHTLHRQAYAMAYETAIMAQKALEHERGEKSDTIQSTNWRADRAGLLAGEQLLLQIQKLERRYEELNTRDLELSKHISLQQLNPFALLKLREEGICHFSFPEELFDLDFPGHYLRRIKSVSITIPCIAGPYTTVNATLKLTGNKICKEPRKAVEPVDMPEETSKIAVSSAQSDSGLFELNFRDERYLPFEGAGAISEWTLEMMYYEEQDTEEDKITAKSLRQFDYNTIADVIIHLRYTAREGGVPFRKEVMSDLKTKLNKLRITSDKTGLYRLFSLRYDFPNEWHAWWTTKGQPMAIKLDKRHFPYFAQMGALKIASMQAYPQVEGETNIQSGIPIPSPDKALDTMEWKLELALAKEINDKGIKPVEDWFVLLRYELGGA